VTVAVSIAVAAWMGALTFNFMATEQLKITNIQFATANVTVTMQNTGTSPVTITEVHINNGALNLIAASFPSGVTLPANNQTIITVLYDWTNGAQYEIEMRSMKGNQFTYSATAPS
jgi:hypothetical protein